jgi:hypothetical protein
MDSWRGLFTENEAKEIINCVKDYSIKNNHHSNRDNLKIAVNEILGSSPMRDSIINKIEALTQEQVNEFINASEGIIREGNINEDVIQRVFNPQPSTDENKLHNSTF